MNEAEEITKNDDAVLENKITYVVRPREPLEGVKNDDLKEIPLIIERFVTTD